MDDFADAALGHRLEQCGSAADIVLIVESGIEIRFADIGKRREMKDGSGSVAHDGLAQAQFVGELTELKSTPLDRFSIAARKIVVCDWIEPGAAQRLQA